MAVLNAQRAGDWMETFTGKMFWPMDPRPEEIDIRDIAHALSNACRYAGHVQRFYSVAEHCVLMSRCFVTADDAKWALLHDASEAYLVDVPRPVKPYLPGYREAEKAVMLAVCRRFGLADLMPAAVHSADNRILCDERAQAMSASGLLWNLAGPPLGVTLEFWAPEVAERHFLMVYRSLFEAK